jgi:tagatose 1,6-diphosphate aldolase
VDFTWRDASKIAVFDPSVVLGGRAFWKEYFLQDGPAARTKFAATEGLKRVAEVDAVVREHGSPWFTKYGLSTQHLVDAAWSALDRPGTPPRSTPLPVEEGEYAPV